MRRFNINLYTQNGEEHHLFQVDDDTWKVTYPRKVRLLRKDGEFVGINFVGHKTYHLGHKVSSRKLSKITRDREGRIFLTLTER